MSVTQANPRGEELSRMIASLRLKEVRQTAIESRRLGDPPAGLNGQTKLEWKHAFGKDDPVKASGSMILFRVHYEFQVGPAEKPYFRHRADFFLFFDLVDAGVFWSLWADGELQELFRSRQVSRTLWPFLRQQVLEGMLRLGLQPVTLPWLM